MKKYTALLSAAALSAGLLTATPALSSQAPAQGGAQQGAPAMQAPQPVEPGTLAEQYDDAELEAFLEVNRDMIPVVQSLSEQGGDIETQEQAQAMMQDFQQRTSAALDEHDLSEQQYQQIGMDASRDEALEQRLIQMDPALYEQLQSLQSEARPQ